METSAASSIPLQVCAHCGLPITTASRPQSGPTVTFCCYACRLAALIVGKQEQGDRSVCLLRLGLGALLAMNVMMISLLLYAGSVDTRLIPLFRLILLALSAPALAVLIPPFLSGASREIRSGSMSLDTLIAGGSLSAFTVSAVNAVRGTGEIYFDTATMLPVLVTFGKLIEASAKSRAADLLKSLEALLPASAQRVTPSGVEEVAVDALQPGDRVRIRPGERIAVDGEIVEGTSTIEEAAFTGEFLPRLCHPGDKVIAGTVNGTGSLLVSAERTGHELLLHGIVDMIRDAWRNPCRAERLAQRVAALFIPAVLTLAALSAVSWVVLGNPAQGLLSALSVLVVACPCTMGIATPLATSLAIARAGKAGIVVRGGSVMEQIAAIGVVFFDKTGTLTVGQPQLQKVVMVDPELDEEELLGRVATLESASEHALGKAIVANAAERGVETGHASGVTITPGCGLSGSVTWRGVTREVSAGSATFVGGEPAATEENKTRGESMADPLRNLTSDDLPLHIPSSSRGRTGWGWDSFSLLEGEGEVEESGRLSLIRLRNDGCSVIDVTWDGELRGRLLLSDTVRSEAGRCIGELANLGVACALLSGDRLSAAAAVASEVGIEEVHAPRTPAEKRQAISAAVAAGRTVAMVGDGINDAPALAEAHAGIALGAGMDLAKQAGNVVILSGSLMQIPWLIALGRRTGKIVNGNFVWSFVYNGVALAAAAAGLLHPLLAALLMVVSSLTVLGNSLRIAGFAEPEVHPKVP